MADFAEIFRKLKDPRKRMRLPLGEHTLLVRSVVIRESATGAGPIIVAEFLTYPDVGSVDYDWAFFISAQGWSGMYEQERCKAFCTAAITAADLQFFGQSIEDLSEAMLQDLRGALVVGRVIEVVDNKNVVRVDRKGKPVVSATWLPIAHTRHDVCVRLAEHVWESIPEAVRELRHARPEDLPGLATGMERRALTEVDVGLADGWMSLYAATQQRIENPQEVVVVP